MQPDDDLLVTLRVLAKLVRDEYPTDSLPEIVATWTSADAATIEAVRRTETVLDRVAD